MMVCDKVCLGVVMTSDLLSSDKSCLPQLMKLQGRGLITVQFLLEKGEIREVQRKPLCASALFQVSIAQNNQYAKAVHFGSV